jgi:hypothetical protein
MSAGVYSCRGRTLSKNRPTVKAVLTLCRKTYAVHEASVRMTCARRAGPHERHESVCIRGQTVIGTGAALSLRPCHIPPGRQVRTGRFEKLRL